MKLGRAHAQYWGAPAPTTEPLSLSLSAPLSALIHSLRDRSAAGPLHVSTCTVCLATRPARPPRTHDIPHSEPERPLAIPTASC